MNINSRFLYLAISLAALCSQVVALPIVPGSNSVRNIEIESGGNVNIDIDESILRILLQEDNRGVRPQQNQKKDLRPGINKMEGYRIQVFAQSANPATLASRARARGNVVVSKFPQYRGQIYTFSSVPNWFTRVGNFRTQADANKALAELRKAFPQFASEMKVVKCEIMVKY